MGNQQNFFYPYFVCFIFNTDNETFHIFCYFKLIQKADVLYIAHGLTFPNKNF